MSHIESYDGLCGVIAPFASSDLQLRCEWCMEHVGKHSWEKYRSQFRIESSCGRSVAEIAERGFLNSVFSDEK